jgi:hypothetical protein
MTDVTRLSPCTEKNPRKSRQNLRSKVVKIHERNPHDRVRLQISLVQPLIEEKPTQHTHRKMRKDKRKCRNVLLGRIWIQRFNLSRTRLIPVKYRI